MTSDERYAQMAHNARPHHLGHRSPCDAWPLANPDGTVTCMCGRARWKPEVYLKTIERRTGATTRRQRLQALRARLRAILAPL